MDIKELYWVQHVRRCSGVVVKTQVYFDLEGFDFKDLGENGFNLRTDFTDNSYTSGKS